MAVTIGDIAGLMRAEDYIGVKNRKSGAEDYVSEAGKVNAEWGSRKVKSITAIYMLNGKAGLLFEVEGE